MLVTVIIPQYLPYKLSYHVPCEMEGEVSVGVRVLLPAVGSKSAETQVTALVSRVLSEAEEQVFISEMRAKGRTLRSITAVVDTFSVVGGTQLALWQWVAEYYMCTEGEVMRYFMPREMLIKGVVSGGGAKYKNSKSITKEKWVRVIDKSLLSASRAGVAKYFSGLSSECDCVSVAELKRVGLSAAQIAKGVKDGFLEAYTKEVFVQLVDNDSLAEESASDNTNTTPNKVAKPLLVVGQSRAELIGYHMEAISKVMEEDAGSVLILQPEESGIETGLKALYGDRCVIYDNNTSSAKRYKIYSRLLNGERLIVVGGKKAVGLPFMHLAHIIVTDEHSEAYKSDSSPRVGVRDVALMLAHIAKTPCVLDSAVPSLESYYNVLVGKFDVEYLPDKESAAKVSVIDKYSIARKDRLVYGNNPQVRYFSKLLIDRMQESHSTLLFHNRRGYNNYLLCGDCSWVYRCEHCNVSMTYHATKRRFVCHYCGAEAEPIMQCPECGTKNIKLKGVGSENVEHSIKKYFPSLPIFRIDGDILKNKSQIVELLANIQALDKKVVIATGGAINILRDISFSTVGVIDADTLFNIADYRAEERAYRLLMLLRNKSPHGDLVLQCSDIRRPLIADIVKGDYKSMAHRQLEVRKAFNYPPFTRLARIVIKSRNENLLNSVATKLHSALLSCAEVISSEPIAPLVDKIKDEYISHIILKFKRNSKMQEYKNLIATQIQKHTQKGVGIFIEVDV